MNQPKPLGELLHCTLQNLYYYSIVQQEKLVEQGMKPRLGENGTIDIGGPRAAGHSWALRKFLLEDCERAMVIAPTYHMAKTISQYEHGNELKQRGHIFAGVGQIAAIKGYDPNLVIFSDYTCMKKTKSKELKLMELCLMPALQCNPSPSKGVYKVLIHLH